MRRFLAALALMTFATSSAFATCGAGYYEQSVDFTAPTSNGNTYGYYSHNGSEKSNNTSPVNLSAGQWRVTWTSSGTAVGEASCNSTSGSTSPRSTAPSDSMSNSANGKYCWCKVTQWIPNSGSSQALPAAWVFRLGDGYPAACARYCVYYCANLVRDDSGFRSAVFGAVATSTCTACPDGGTSDAGATAITQCYIPTSTTMTDAAGTYHYSSNCYYSE